MTSREKKLRRVERQVIKDCRAAQKRGWRLTRWQFVDQTGRKPACCPITAVALAASQNNIPESDLAPGLAGLRLGLNRDEVFGIIYGVDGEERQVTLPSQRELFELGARVRRALRVRH